MDGDIDGKMLDMLVSTIKDIRTGLDPSVIEDWYRIIEDEARKVCPPKLSSSISIQQDPDLPVKYRIRASKRAVPYVIEAVERHLNEMPFATRLYFQKLEEIVLEEAGRYGSGEDKKPTEAAD